MLSYLLLTYLLSLVGWLIYKMFWSGSSQHRMKKILSQTILISSLIIPLLVISWINFTQTQQPEVRQQALLEVCSSFCPSEQSLEICYIEATQIDDFCSCVNISKDNILVYTSNSYYDFLLSGQSVIIRSSVYLALGLLFLLILRLTYLLYVIRISEKSHMSIDGVDVIILDNDKSLGVGAFRLHKNYIIWQRDMDGLDDLEQQSILRHELSHIMQHDTWWRILLNLLQIIWIVNPFFYLWKAEIDQLSEFIADEYAILKSGHRKMYAQLLIKMKRRQNIALVSGFKTTKDTFFQKRIENILAFREVHRSSSIPSILFILLLFSAATLLSSHSITEALHKMEIYENLESQHSRTGQSIFCKECHLH